MQVIAEFVFDAGNNVHIIFDSLFPELHENYQRTKSSLEVRNNLLFLKVIADDLVSMRAALNGWLRLIKITCEMCTLDPKTQAIN